MAAGLRTPDVRHMRRLKSGPASAGALTQYARGTQLSIVGVGTILLCAECDAEMLEWSEGRAVPSTYQPAALDPAAAAKRKDAGGGNMLITP